MHSAHVANNEDLNQGVLKLLCLQEPALPVFPPNNPPLAKLKMSVMASFRLSNKSVYEATYRGMHTYR